MKTIQFILKLFTRVATFLIMLELCFLIGGKTIQWGRMLVYQFQLAQRQGARVILCIGDSITQGSPENNYPHFLQELIDTRLPDKNIIIINQGTAGHSAKMIAAKVPMWIDQYLPDAVITMFGGFDLIKEQKAQDPWFKKSRVGKTIMTLSSAIKQRLTPQLKQATSHPPSPEVTNQPASTNNQLLTLYLQSQILKQSGRVQESLQLLLRLVESQSINSELQTKAYRDIMDVLWQAKQYLPYIKYMQYTHSYHWDEKWMDTLCTNPQYIKPLLMVLNLRAQKNPRYPIYYELVADCAKTANMSAYAKEMSLKATQIRRKQIESIARKHYETLVTLLLEKNIQPVLMEYPLRDGKILEEVFNNTAYNRKIIFVNNGPAFIKGVFKEGYSEYFLDHHLGDSGHLTQKGNRLLAENIFEALNDYLK